MKRDEMSKRRHDERAAVRENYARKPLEKQVSDALRERTAFGTSRHEDKRNGVDTYKKIYSHRTYETYVREGRAFVKWCQERADVRTLDDCKPMRERYIQYQIDEGYSPSTIKTRAASLGKLYGDRFMLSIKTPVRSRDTITRSRDDAVRDSRFSEEKNKDLVDFCKNTGLRRHELRGLRCGQLHEEDGRLWIKDVKGKGGKVRDVPVLKTGEETVRRMMTGKPGDQVFPKKIHSCADIHGYRAEYACEYYRQVARPVEELKKSERYDCRADMAGVKLDKRAMLEVSRALGHNRIDVIASNYLYNL